jgi:hypothetical protein
MAGSGRGRTSTRNPGAIRGPSQPPRSQPLTPSSQFCPPVHPRHHSTCAFLTATHTLALARGRPRQGRPSCAARSRQHAQLLDQGGQRHQLVRPACLLLLRRGTVGMRAVLSFTCSRTGFGTTTRCQQFTRERFCTRSIHNDPRPQPHQHDGLLSAALVHRVRLSRRRRARRDLHGAHEHTSTLCVWHIASCSAPRMRCTVSKAHLGDANRVPRHVPLRAEVRAFRRRQRTSAQTSGFTPRCRRCRRARESGGGIKAAGRNVRSAPVARLRCLPARVGYRPGLGGRCTRWEPRPGGARWVRGGSCKNEKH